ncbi:MAG: hypothetical protein GF353_12165 [Candidatus Lokiarchaeota archaeon]|nr:hypothetical protein [Candidatus Lokiarchaeota archaeon]
MLGSIVLESEDINHKEAETGLLNLLNHIEIMCPELERDELDQNKIEFFVKQYATNLL